MQGWAMDETVTKTECDFRLRRTFRAFIDALQEGVHIRLSSPVVRVTWDDGPDSDASVQTSSGAKIFARKVVVTAPPTVVRRLIDFVPPLPRPFRDALSSFNMFNVVKVVAAFSQRPWPANLTGMIMAGCEFPEMWFKDLTELAPDSFKPENGGSARPCSETPLCIATGFLTADFAESALAKGNIEAGFLAQMDRVLGLLSAESVGPHLCASKGDRLPFPKPSTVCVGTEHYEWGSCPFVGGGYAATKVGVRASDVAILQQPCNDTIFFAGEAYHFPTCVTQNALDSGRRAAAQIIACKTETSPSILNARLSHVAFFFVSTLLTSAYT
jgi:hypothetical protein